jgi:hypothetical protein
MLLRELVRKEMQRRTKYKIARRNQDIDVANRSFGNVTDFKYLERNQNFTIEEIKSSL